MDACCPEHGLYNNVLTLSSVAVCQLKQQQPQKHTDKSVSGEHLDEQIRECFLILCPLQPGLKSTADMLVPG
jgi:hypothetical protein